jgi:cytochrome c oxidase subunit 2
MDRFLPQASTFASEIDGIILLVAVLVGFWSLAAYAVFFWLIWKFRKKPAGTSEYLTGDEKQIKRWVTYPHLLVLVCDVFIIVGAVRGADNELDTPDDIFTVDELHVEVDRVYHYRLESRDVLHSFSIPVFRLKQDAIPGRSITGWFEATRTGEYDVQCAEICGIGHGVMAARIFIEDASRHQAWIAANSVSTSQ